jgi:tRNA pseudouridine38-40 synthase
MIRIIAKRLIDIGKGDLTVDDFEGILSGRIVPSEITIAYPQGLYLAKVKYPFLDLPPRSEFAGGYSNKSSYWEEL